MSNKNEYVQYNSKKNAHWGKQPLSYYFNELKSWREDLNVDYDIEIEELKEADKPSIYCVDHSQVKPLPGATSFSDINYPTDGLDVITLGLERLQGIERQPDIPSTPDPGSNPQSNLIQLINDILYLIENDYMYEYSMQFYIPYNNLPTNVLVTFSRWDSSADASSIPLFEYSHFYLIDGNGTIINELINETNEYNYNYNEYNEGQTSELYISPEWIDEMMNVYGSVSGHQGYDSPTYPTIIIGIP